ncbi:hypothetical protein NQ315_001803 [Exocentrus adspersus]|uniref:Glyceraldehyde 3-phosphate dehydrogenase NAD(P) binding domain-containing protein n=1 Tax=Exocentrus adspersus TaxID=1586481 RepID=A0AAV8WA94_9CUCU|nr:hypothetical protein NQ315_001803 [Exocentrus adspersus]
MVKIGINGFGRLGRQLLKIALIKSKEKTVADIPKLVMINDANVPTECLNKLIKKDTYHGNFSVVIETSKDGIILDGSKIHIFRETAADKAPWSKIGVDYVIDTTGRNSSCADASKYVTAGVKRIIVTGCSNIPMFVMGVNHACITKEMKSISATSPSMNCLAPILRVLHEFFEIEEAASTAFIPLDNSDNILDDGTPHGCRAIRSVMGNFYPTSATTKGSFINKIIPELEGKTESSAIKIPVPCVGAIDITVKFRKEAPINILRCKLKEASQSYMQHIMGFTDDDVGSSDIIGNPNSCVVDAKATIAISKCSAKVFAWYDAEYAFANRLYDLAKYLCSREDCV